MAATLSPIPLDEAVRRVAQEVPLGARPAGVPLLEALGLFLSRDVHAATDLPEADRAAMDGFAVRTADLARGPADLRVAGESRAGAPFQGTLPPGCAVRIMTGAALPEGADAVVRVEETPGFQDAARRGVVSIATVPTAGADIRGRACEVARGERLLEAGTRLGAAELGVLAALGMDPVPAHARARVAVVPTGDEVVDVDRTPAPHQVRNSNAMALYGQILEAGALPVLLPVAPDDRAILAQRLRQALDACDFVVTIGGVSKGAFDLVAEVLEELGVETLFHGLAVKPGKPTLFGRRAAPGGAGGAVLVFGLPGNPASCFTIFHVLVRDALARWMGCRGAPPARRPRASLWFSKVRPDGRLQVLPGRLRLDPSGVVVEQTDPGPSSSPFHLARGDALFLVPPGEGPRDGDLVEFLPL